MKGRTKWFPRWMAPTRIGDYECAVQITNSAPCILWRLHWDGVGFRVPVPMVVRHWRGMTKKAHDAMKENNHG